VSQKALDKHGRWRSVSVGFRMSPEEAALLDAKVAASGLAKQDYITSRLLERDVTVLPSSRLQKGLAQQMNAVYRELRRIEQGAELSSELEELVALLAREFLALGMEDRASDTEAEAALIRGLSRG
jgi:hypothetical protein